MFKSSPVLGSTRRGFYFWKINISETLGPWLQVIKMYFMENIQFGQLWRNPFGPYGPNFLEKVHIWTVYFQKQNNRPAESKQAFFFHCYLWNKFKMDFILPKGTSFAVESPSSSLQICCNGVCVGKELDELRRRVLLFWLHFCKKYTLFYLILYLL